MSYWVKICQSFSLVYNAVLFYELVDLNDSFFVLCTVLKRCAKPILIKSYVPKHWAPLLLKWLYPLCTRWRYCSSVFHWVIYYFSGPHKSLHRYGCRNIKECVNMYYISSNTLWREGMHLNEHIKRNVKPSINLNAYLTQ